jgi:hypothetical protein
MGELVARPGKFFVGWEYHEDVDSGESSDAIYMEPLGGDGGRITLSLRAGANTGKIQFTTVDSAKVIANTVASGDWTDWSTYTDEGLSTGTLHETIISPITGVRCVSISGAVSFDIVI